MVDFLEKQVPPTDALIIGGDFNIAPVGDFYEALWDEIIPDLKSKMGYNFKQSKFASDQTFTTKEGKLDHLFFSPQFRIANGQVVLKDTNVEVFEEDEHGKKSKSFIMMSDHFGWETSTKLK